MCVCVCVCVCDHKCACTCAQIEHTSHKMLDMEEPLHNMLLLVHVPVHSTPMYTDMLSSLHKPSLSLKSTCTRHAQCTPPLHLLQDGPYTRPINFNICSPVLSKTPPGLQSRYLAANSSMILSIFCASPGK